MSDNAILKSMSADSILSIIIAWLLILSFFYPEGAGKFLGQIHKAYLAEMQSVEKK